MAPLPCQRPCFLSNRSLNICSSLSGASSLGRRGCISRKASPSTASAALQTSSLSNSAGLGSLAATPRQAAPAWHGRPHQQQGRRSTTPLQAAHAAQAVPLLNNPAFQYVSQRLLKDVGLPVIIALLLIQGINVLAARATKAYESADESVLELELLRMAPIALHGPTRWTLLVLVGTRAIRNSVAIFDAFIHKFHSKLDDAVALMTSYQHNPCPFYTPDPFVDAICNILGPLDAALLKLYGAVMLGCLTWVLVQWKTIAITYYVRYQRRHQAPNSDLERALLPFNSVTSWIMAVLCGLYILHWYGFNLQPLLAVGGASSIIIGLATQQTLTNAVNGLFLFLTRPFVTGEFVTLQGGGVVLNGIVENVGIMRTIVRNEDDTLVSVPNKVVSDMTIQNRTAVLSKTNAADRIHLQQPIKMRVKLPHNALDKLNELMSKIQNELQDMTCNPKSVVVSVNKFTDQGIELLVKVLVDDVDSPRSQAGLLTLYGRAREYGGTLISA